MEKPISDSLTQENEEDFFRSLKRHEQGFIGAILRENSLMPYALEHVWMNSFQFRPHRLIFAVMTELYKSQRSISPENVVNNLRFRRELVEAGGDKYILALERNVPPLLTTDQDDYISRFIMIAIGISIQEAAFNQIGGEELDKLIMEKLEVMKQLKEGNLHPLPKKSDKLNN